MTSNTIRTKAEELMKKVLCALAGAFLLTLITNAQTPPNDEHEAIKATALNYIEGWYEGDAARNGECVASETSKANDLDGSKNRAQLV